MKTERILQTCVALMAALATLMLGTSQESSSLPVIAVIVAAASLVFTDFLGWFHLNRYVSGAAGLIAVVNTFLQTQAGGLDTQFISVANLLIYLQIVLLFQKKTLRVYWQLIVLSLLQVVVASALNLFVLFGPLLVCYTAIAISGLLVFYIHRETAPFLPGVGVLALNGTDSSSVVRVEHAGTPIRIDGKKEFSARRSLIAGNFLRQFSLMSISTLVVSAAVFLLMPRFGDGVWRANGEMAQTGYSGEVDLNDHGRVLESPAVVMRVSFFVESSGNPYDITGTPYFRGSILNEYIAPARWRRTRGRRQLDVEDLGDLEAAKKVHNVVRQEFTMQRQRAGTVFSVCPPKQLVTSPSTLKFNPPTHEIIYQPSPDEDPAEYAVGTTAFRNGTQCEFVPVLDGAALPFETDRDQATDGLPRLAAKASEILAEADINHASSLERARTLETYFANSGLFRYSLDASPNRDPDQYPNPVEDFALNHRTGYCQHFASALTLMLRSQGIPARIVVGYHGGLYNAVGDYYQIRELDAHAWVEARIPGEELPDDELLPLEGFELASNGTKPAAWVRLDPTPAGLGSYTAKRPGPLRQKFNDGVDYIQLLWSEYVLGLNQKRQQKAIYEPIKNAFHFVSDALFNRDRWAARSKALQDRFRGELFSRQNIRDAVIVLSILTCLFYVLRFAWNLLMKLIRRMWSKRMKLRRPQIEFYRRLEGILARHGLRRETSQTPREFAAVAGESLAGSLGLPNLAAIPHQVVDHFYDVRFGDRRLDTVDVQRLENSIHELQRALASRKR